MVLVQLFAYFQEALGKKDVNIDAGNIYELVDNLTRDNDKLSGLLFESHESYIIKSDVIILVNGRNIEGLEGMKTKLKKSDIISIFPPVCGG